jgi:hypothetical protein
MKHLKSYKIFEGISSTDLELDVRDMFLELEEDYGYSVGVSMRPSGVDMFCVEASRDELFQWVDVKDYFERAHDYILENGWVLTKSVLCYYPQGDYNGSYRIKTKEFSGYNWNGFIEFITDSTFIENNMINEIALIFDPKKIEILT